MFGGNFMNNGKIDIRSKTIKKLNLENSPSAVNKLIEEIIEFRDTTFLEAFRIIFILLYSNISDENFNTRKQILHKFGFTCWKNDLPFYKFLNEEQIVQLGNELRYQYTQANPEFLSVEDNSAYHEELICLQNAMSNHPLLFFKAVRNCKQHAYKEYVVYAEQLLSNKVSSQLYGLRQLGHNKQYQELLQPYAAKIGNLLLAMYNANKEDQENLIDYVEETSSEIPEKQPIDITNEIDSKPEEDEIQKAFDEKKYFNQNFIENLIKLRKLGISIDSFVDSMIEDDISSISESFQTVIKVTDTLFNAMDALDDAMDALDDAVIKLRSPFVELVKFI